MSSFEAVLQHISFAYLQVYNKAFSQGFDCLWSRLLLVFENQSCVNESKKLL